MRLFKGIFKHCVLALIFKTFVNGHQETVSKIPLLCPLSPILAPPPPTKMPIIGQQYTNGIYDEFLLCVMWSSLHPVIRLRCLAKRSFDKEFRLVHF